MAVAPETLDRKMRLIFSGLLVLSPGLAPFPLWNLFVLIGARLMGRTQFDFELCSLRDRTI